MKFTLNRDRVHASVLGLSVEFRKGVPTHVPPELYAEVQAIGAVPDDEIEDQHHMALLYWVKHLAYSVHDADTFDRRKAEDYETKFLAYCERADAEQTRARRQVGSTQYGGL